MINRYIPFGYYIADAQIKVNETEAKVVRDVFRNYIDGASLKDLASQLTMTGTEFLPGRSDWDANRVYRLLCNEKYAGGNEFAAAGVVNHVVALEYGGDRVAVLGLARQTFLGLGDVVEQFLLLLGQFLFTLLAPPILDVVEKFRARIGLGFVFGVRRRGNQHGRDKWQDAPKFFHRQSSSMISMISSSS